MARVLRRRVMDLSAQSFLLLACKGYGAYVDED